MTSATAITTSFFDPAVLLYKTDRANESFDTVRVRDLIDC